MNIPKITLISFYPVKGTVLGRVLWGANTFLTRNRLPDSQSGSSQTSLILIFFGFP